MTQGYCCEWIIVVEASLLSHLFQAIDIIFQVWEHVQKSKDFLPNKAYFIILLRIVFNFLNKNSLFHALFLHFMYYKTNHMWQKVYFFTDQWQFEVIYKIFCHLEFFSGTYVPEFPYFSMPCLFSLSFPPPPICISSLPPSVTFFFSLQG